MDTFEWLYNYLVQQVVFVAHQGHDSAAALFVASKV